MSNKAKFLLVYVLFGIALLFLANACQTIPTPTDFTIDNKTIQVIGFMTADLMENPLKELKALPEGETAYLYIFSAGGDSLVAEKFIDALQGRKSVCFSNMAGGGAFTVFQSCTYRIVGEKALLGTSRLVVRGSSGNEETDRKFREQAETLGKKMLDIDSDRLGLSNDEYGKLLDESFAWDAKTALEKNAADLQLDMQCAAGTQSLTLTRTIRGGGQQIPLKLTTCPLLRKLVEPKGLPAQQLGEMIGIPLFGSASDELNPEFN